MIIVNNDVIQEPSDNFLGGGIRATENCKTAVKMFICASMYPPMESLTPANYRYVW